jgi:hypothetical protein
VCSGMRCQKNNLSWLQEEKPRQSVFDGRKYDLSCPPTGSLGKRGVKIKRWGASEADFFLIAAMISLR